MSFIAGLLFAWQGWNCHFSSVTLSLNWTSSTSFHVEYTSKAEIWQCLQFSNPLKQLPTKIRVPKVRTRDGGGEIVSYETRNVVKNVWFKTQFFSVAFQWMITGYGLEVLNGQKRKLPEVFKTQQPKKSKILVLRLCPLWIKTIFKCNIPSQCK